MRRNICCHCACLIVGTLLAGCTANSPPPPKVETVAPAPVVRRSPHIVMVSLAGGETATRDQQPYLIKLQEQIASRWHAVPAKLKYTVGLEFMVTQPGLCCNTQPVSSLAPRKMIESCTDAIMSVGQFDPLPPQFKSNPQTFLCEFMYNPPAGGESPTQSTSGPDHAVSK